MASFDDQVNGPFCEGHRTAAGPRDIIQIQQLTRQEGTKSQVRHRENQLTVKEKQKDPKNNLLNNSHL